MQMAGCDKYACMVNHVHRFTKVVRHTEIFGHPREIHSARSLRCLEIFNTNFVDLELFAEV